MNICIVGPGAIGALWASTLHQQGHAVHLWTRTDADSTPLQLDDFPLYHYPSNQAAMMQQSDLVIIAVKAWQVKQAVSAVRPHLPQDCPLLFTHNGMGATEEIESEIQGHPVLFATTTHGAYKPDATQVLHTGKGTTVVGALNESGHQFRSLTKVLDAALPEVHWDNNLMQALWNKLAINCCINPLTALLNCKNGGLDQDETLQLIHQLCAELESVMRAEGQEADQGILFERARQVIVATKENYSSMYQDIHHGRRSEIDYITGYLIRCAQRHSLSVPLNQQLYDKIKLMENPA